MAQQAPQPPGSPKPPNQGSIWTWWLITMLVLVVWNVFTLPRPATQVTIPYSTLLAQVRAGNVTRVHVTGDDVTGAFRLPFAPPSPVPSSAASPTPNASAPPKPQTYTDFDTTFPQAIGDTGFLPLLESQHVTIDVSTTRTNVLVTLLITWGPMLLLVGAVLAGCVQDFTVLVASVRHRGRSIADVARTEISPFAGLVAMIAVLFILLVTLAGLGIVVVNALSNSPWGVFTIGMTIPIAVIMGWWMFKSHAGVTASW